MKELITNAGVNAAMSKEEALLKTIIILTLTIERLSAGNSPQFVMTICNLQRSLDKAIETLNLGE